MWLYAREELVHYSGAQPGIRFRATNFKPNATTGQQICTSRGTVWFLGNHVLHRIKDGSVMRLDPDSPTSSTSYRHVYCESDGTIWVGHNKFVRKFDTARLGSATALPMRVQTVADNGYGSGDASVWDAHNPSRCGGAASGPARNAGSGAVPFPGRGFDGGLDGERGTGALLHREPTGTVPAGGRYRGERQMEWESAGIRLCSGTETHSPMGLAAGRGGPLWPWA